MIVRGKDAKFALDQFLYNLQATIMSTKDTDLLLKIKTTLEVFKMSEDANWDSCCNATERNTIIHHKATCDYVIQKIDKILSDII